MPNVSTYTCIRYNTPGDTAWSDTGRAVSKSLWVTRRSAFLAVAIALPLLAPTSIVFAASPCSNYNYVGNAYNLGFDPGNITANVTFDVPTGYTGQADIVSLTVNPNTYLGEPLSWPSSGVGLNGFVVCALLPISANTFSNGQIINWAFTVVLDAPPVYCSLEPSTETLTSDNYTPSTGDLTVFDAFDVEPINGGGEFGDGQVNSNPGVWTLASSNPPPVAVAEAVSAPNNQPVQIDLTSGSACGATAAALVTKPLKGTVTGFPSTTVLYTPLTGAAGSDSFQYVLSNGGGKSNLASATIMFAPLAVNENVSTQENTEITIDLTAGADGSPTSAKLIGSPVGGTVKGFPGTTVTFKPDKGQTGLAGGFDFELANSLGTSNTAVVTVWTTLFSAETKQAFARQGAVLGQVSNIFDFASIVTDPKNIVANVKIAAATNVLSKLIAGNDEITGQKIDFMTSSAIFAMDAFKHFAKTNQVSAFFEAEALVSQLGSLGANIIASDPPDPNYKSVAKPRKLTFPKTGNATLDKINGDYLTFSSLTAATVHAAERWQGAMLAGDQVSATKQKNALTKYYPETVDAQNVMNADNATLAGAFQPVNLATFPGGATALAAAFNKQCGKPLPPSLNKILLSYTTQTIIDSTVCSYSNSVTPIDISTDFGAILQ